MHRYIIAAWFTDAGKLMQQWNDGSVNAVSQ